MVISLTDENRGVSGHVGVVTDYYDDKMTPYTSDTEVWILPPTIYKTSQP